MATIYDVAQQAGVSVATVSAVINNSAYVSPSLREKVESAIASLSYTPNHLARSLTVKQTHTIGMIIPDITNPVYPEMVRGAEDRAQKAGYTIILGNSDNQKEKEEAYLNVFLSKKVDGILLIKAHEEMNPSMLEKLRLGPPLVLLGREYPSLQTYTVITDAVGGAREAVNYLIRLGHRRIGIITGASTIHGRLLGYQKALEENNIPFEESLTAEGHYGIDLGYEAASHILRQRPTAVFITNTSMIVGFLRALDKLNLRCPEDIALVSYDDLGWSEEFRPTVTSVEQPKYLLGSRGIDVLLGRIKGKHKRPKVEVLKNVLHYRESSGAPLNSTSA